MQTVVPVLSGFLVGGLIVHWLMVRKDRAHARTHDADTQYRRAIKTVQDHIRVRGTINLVQAEHVLAVHAQTAMRYLDHMERDGILISQGHTGAGTFYTCA